MARRKSSGSAIKLVVAIGNAAYKASVEAERRQQREAQESRNRIARKAADIEYHDRIKEREAQRQKVIDERERLDRINEEQRLRIIQQELDLKLDNGEVTIEGRVLSRIKISSRLRAVLFVKDNAKCSLYEAIEKVAEIETNSLRN